MTKGYSSHSGRRTFATRLIANGTPYEVVQQLLGHAHLDQLSAYVDVSMREMRDSIAAIHLAT
ncbi:tyrosine-type recombinase/integrase [Robbsia andropogonis]|uniref:tyrosine-type recombinase/integrase n=1 Tax=Robbsia andropogonis TaxID=28092 RepID=UPI001EEEC9B1|nr:tyrosine-type recombinase/integrase [Robbsia andropogonis]